MAVGAGMGSLVTALLPLVGIVTILRARARRKAGTEVPDQEHADRLAATQEAERRMAAYLASRDARNWHDDGGQG